MPYCAERRSTAQCERDLITFVDIICLLVTFVTNKKIKNKNLIIHQNKCWPQKQINMGGMFNVPR